MSNGQQWEINSKEQLEVFINWTRNQWNEHKYLKFSKITKSKQRTSSMNALWWIWMTETSKFMADNGVYMPLYHDKTGKPHGKRPFSKEDAHELFVMHHLGQHEGKREKTFRMDKGTMLLMMEKHQEWAINKGIALTNPDDSEFRKAQDEQNS